MKNDIDWEKIARVLEDEQNVAIDTLSTEEQAELHLMKKLWATTQELGKKSPSVSSLSVEKAKEQMWQRIQSKQEKTTTQEPITMKPSAKRRTIWSYVAVAATLILPILVYTWFSRSETNSVTGTVSGTVIDKIQEVKMPDGSVATLQTGEMAYAFDPTSNTRKVSLTGNAFFKVARNENYPFIIESQHAIVSVLGTSFQLDASLEQTTVHLKVATGLVSFQAKTSETPLLVHAQKDEIIDYNAQTGELKKTFANNQHYISYQNGYIAFDATLADLVSFISDWTGQDIKLSDTGLSKTSLISTQGVVYEDVYSFLEKISLPIADKAVVVQLDNQIVIQRKK